jgi:HEPN domain-containing protein
MADAAAAAAALQAQITAAVTAALAAQAAAAPVAHVAVKLPDFWVKDPKMWFSQAEAQFRRARITAVATMYDYVLMKLPEDVVMSIRALISEIEADPVKQENSYQLLKDALLGSYGKTKWQMAYALLDHPDLGDRHPSAMMTEMLSLRFETSAPDSLFLALFLRRLPSSIRDHLAAADHKTATEMAAHADILWDARNNASQVAAVSDSLAAVSVRSASPKTSRSPDRRARSPDRRGNFKGKQHFRRPTPGRQDNRSNNANSRLCFYHDQYGVKALKCHAPCSWTEN